MMAFTSGSFDLVLFLLTLATALGIQISCNLVNDYKDFLKGADTPERQGPLRVTSAGLISVEGMKKASLVSLLITGLCGSYLIWQGGLLIGLLLVVSLLLAYCYTAGPFPIAYLGGGELLVFLFFGPTAVAATFYLQTGTLCFDAIIAGCAPGAFSSGILIANNLRDATEDALHKKKTLVVRFGTPFGKGEYLFFVLLGLFLPYYFLFTHPFTLLATLTFVPAIFTFHTLFTSKELVPLLSKTAKLLLLHSLLFCIGWML